MSIDIKSPKVIFEEHLNSPQLYVNRQSEKNTEELQGYILKEFNVFSKNINCNRVQLNDNALLLKETFKSNTELIKTELSQTHMHFCDQFNKYNQTLKNINIKCDNILNIQNIVDKINISQIKYSEEMDELNNKLDTVFDRLDQINCQLTDIKTKLYEYEIEDIESETDEAENIESSAEEIESGDNE